jgi:trehalose 6-phosphate phosphatase
VHDALLPFVADPDHAAVLVDYDGSLAPIVDDPEAAVPLPEARDALGRLAGTIGVVGVVSGRPVRFLHDALALPGIVYVGQYGLERLDGDEPVADPRVLPYLGRLEEAASDAEGRFPDLIVERKGLAVTLHWRQQPARETEARAWATDVAERLDLGVLWGRAAAELRAPVDVDKGSAVTTLARGCTAGDDVGDLPAWDALDRLVAQQELGTRVRVAVRSIEEPPEIVARADLHVEGPRGLAALLGELSAALA